MARNKTDTVPLFAAEHFTWDVSHHHNTTHDDDDDVNEDIIIRRPSSPYIGTQHYVHTNVHFDNYHSRFLVSLKVTHYGKGIS